MRLIDADELMRSHCVECTYYNSGECLGANCDWDSIGHIREAKTVEAIPVEWLLNNIPNDGRMYYQSVINEPNPDDYCSRAERKEE